MADLKHACPRCQSLDNSVKVVSSKVNHFPGLVAVDQSQVVIHYMFMCSNCGYEGTGKLHGWLKESNRS